MSSSQPRRLPLQDLALAASSLRAYNKQLAGFLLYSRLTHQQFLTAPAFKLDRLLAVYIQHCFDASVPFTYASHALHAATFHRLDLKTRLFTARQCLKGWASVKQTNSHAPLTWELTLVIACTIARSGHHAAAVAMLVGFDCYLRVGELLRLRRRDIVMPNDARMGSADRSMAVCLGQTKTGRNQDVPLQNPDIMAVLCLWMRSLPPSHGNPLVFDLSAAKLRRLMHEACISLGVRGHYVPHSLRHGGATFDFLRTRDIDHVQFRGRWKSMETARNYVQTARALLAAQQVPQRLNDLGQLFSRSLLAVMTDALRSPPAYRRRIPSQL